MRLLIGEIWFTVYTYLYCVLCVQINFCHRALCVQIMIAVALSKCLGIQVSRSTTRMLVISIDCTWLRDQWSVSKQKMILLLHTKVCTMYCAILCIIIYVYLGFSLFPCSLALFEVQREYEHCFDYDNTWWPLWIFGGSATIWYELDESSCPTITECSKAHKHSSPL